MMCSSKKPRSISIVAPTRLYEVERTNNQGESYPMKKLFLIMILLGVFASYSHSEVLKGKKFQITRYGKTIVQEVAQQKGINLEIYAEFNDNQVSIIKKTSYQLESGAPININSTVASNYEEKKTDQGVFFTVPWIFSQSTTKIDGYNGTISNEMRGGKYKVIKNVNGILLELILTPEEKKYGSFSIEMTELRE